MVFLHANNQYQYHDYYIFEERGITTSSYPIFFLRRIDRFLCRYVVPNTNFLVKGILGQVFRSHWRDRYTSYSTSFTRAACASSGESERFLNYLRVRFGSVQMDRGSELYAVVAYFRVLGYAICSFFGVGIFRSALHLLVFVVSTDSIYLSKASSTFKCNCVFKVINVHSSVLGYVRLHDGSSVPYLYQVRIGVCTSRTRSISFISRYFWSYFSFLRFDLLINQDYGLLRFGRCSISSRFAVCSCLSVWWVGIAFFRPSEGLCDPEGAKCHRTQSLG